MVLVGVEFQVNTYTPDFQFLGDVAGNDDGFLVVWVSPGQDFSGHGVFAKRYSSAGVAQGVEFQVNQRTLGVQARPNVALADGGFIVVWQDDAKDGGGYGVF